MKRMLLLFFLCATLFTSAWSQQTVGLFSYDSLSYNGYTLFAPMTNTTTYLIDNCGKLINSWESEYFPAASVYLLENGDLLRTCRLTGTPFTAGGTGGRFERYNWEGELVWSYEYSTDFYHHHHDVEPMANGNLLVIAWEYRSEVEAIEAGRDPATVGPNGLWAERVVELEPVGTDQANIVWQWSLWDHLVQDFDPTKENFGVVADHPGKMDLNFTTGGPNSTDWIHLNSIDYNPELDQIMLCSRPLNEFWVIDHSLTTQEAAGPAGDFLYRYGNPIVYDRGTEADQMLFVQHDAHWIEAGLPDAGKIMVFNNGATRPDGAYSTVDVLDPPLFPDGTYEIEANQPYGPFEFDWTYMADPPTDFFSQNISGAGRLPNGNTLICEGRNGRFFEVDPDGNIHWEYINPVVADGPITQGDSIAMNGVFRTYRYALNHPGLVDKDLTPGAPLELDPLPYDCTIFEEPVSASELPASDLPSFVLQNPISEVLSILNPLDQPLDVRIYDSTGKLVTETEIRDAFVEIPSGKWAPGLYIVQIRTAAFSQLITRKVIKF